MPQTFSKREALRFGWDAVIKNMGFFVVALLVFWAAELLFRGIGDYFNNSRAPLIAVIFSLIAFLIGLFAKMGFVRISLKINAGGAPDREDFRPAKTEFWNYLATSVLVGLIVGVGFVLLIVPGLMALTALQYAPFFVIDKKLSFSDAIRASYETTKGFRWEIFVFDLMCLGTIIIGALVIGIGLFVAIPMVIVAQGYAYRRLVDRPAVVATA